MHAVLQDIRYALRQLQRTPGFTFTAVFMLALAIGATTAVFTLFNGVLLRPLPYADPGRLVAISSLGYPRGAESQGGVPTMLNATSMPDFFDWREQNRSLDAIAGYESQGYTLASGPSGPARLLMGQMVTADFFRVMGLQPLLGRTFTREEEKPGNHSVILSEALWRSEFQASPAALGRTIRLGDEPYTVIGVVPAGFAFPSEQQPADVWTTPAGQPEQLQNRGWHDLEVVGRLKRGVSVEQARAELTRIQQTIAERYPDEKSNPAVSVQPAKDALVAGVRAALNALLAAVACVLLIACVNIAGLLLTRVYSRRSDLAVRVSLGASRTRILRQIFTESLLLAIAGGLLGLALAYSLLREGLYLLPPNLPRTGHITLDPVVLTFALVVTVITGVLFGILPAWRVSRLDPMQTLRDGSRSVAGSRGQHRVLAALVICETALSFLLLAGAGLFLRSFDRILRVDPGFHVQNLLTFSVGLPEKRYDPAQKVAFYCDLLGRLSALPGVRSATAAGPLPLTGGDMSITFTLPRQPRPRGEEPSARLTIAERSFFETLGIPLRRGRFFEDEDNRQDARPVVIVNEAFAKKFFPGVDPVGQLMNAGIGVKEGTPDREVVGVVGNVKRQKLTEASEPEYYLPYAQVPAVNPRIAIRYSGDAVLLIAAARKAVAAIDPEVPVYRVQTLDESVARSTAQQRFDSWLLSAFAAVALLLAAIGLYGTLAYSVSQRTLELGVRMALGARRADLMRHVLVRGMRLAVAGTALGMLLAIAATRTLASLLYGVRALDGATFAAVCVLLLAVAGLSSLLPARRASHVDPMRALRSE